MKKLVAAMLVMAFAASLKANTEGYVMLSVWHPGQIPIATTSLDGLRLNLLYGECQNLNGLDLGMAGKVRERMNGLQLGLLFNIVGTDAAGAALACANYVESDFSGVQFGVWNGVGGDGRGAQVGVWNDAKNFAGLQLGVVNWAKVVSGLQLGIVNCATFGGDFVQIGLANFNLGAVNEANGERTLGYVLPFFNMNW